MERLITHIAHNNDLYEIIFTLGGSVQRVTIFPDNNGQAGTEHSFWSLPQEVRLKIRERIAEYSS